MFCFYINFNACINNYVLNENKHAKLYFKTQLRVKMFRKLRVFLLIFSMSPNGLLNGIPRFKLIMN